MQHRNCLSHWFPPLLAAGLPVPRTEIVETDCELWRLMDGCIPDGYKSFLKRLQKATDLIGYPCFLRTGLTAGKHEWLRTCYLDSPDVLAQHVGDLVEYSALASIMGLATNVWAARQLIKTKPAFHAFHGLMPVTREFRLFTSGGEVVCCHPYWPPNALRASAVVSNWKERLAKLSILDGDTKRYLRSLAYRAVQAIDGGSWSVDLLQDVDGKWWITDMAMAAVSWHWPDCPNAEERLSE